MGKIKKIYLYFLIVGLCLVFYWYEIYVPKNFTDTQSIEYIAQKGQGDEEISTDLQSLGIIHNKYFFRIYVLVSNQHAKIKAGKYILSKSMSAKQIVDKMVKGEVVKEKITIIEGWDLQDIKNAFVDKKLCSKTDFNIQVDNSLLGYIFPDTYDIGFTDNCQTITQKAKNNFEKKLTADLRAEIIKQKKTISDIVIMASLIEKEVRSLNDKKIVSGILWKRIAIGMPLQVDVHKETYKIYGLPNNAICNPGIDSIIAAIYPTKSNYLYYLSAKDGTTIFSKTLAEHNIAIAKYLR